VSSDEQLTTSALSSAPIANNRHACRIGKFKLPSTWMKLSPVHITRGVIQLSARGAVCANFHAEKRRKAG